MANADGGLILARKCLDRGARTETVKKAGSPRVEVNLLLPGTPRYFLEGAFPGFGGFACSLQF